MMPLAPRNFDLLRPTWRFVAGPPSRRTACGNPGTTEGLHG